MTDFLRPPRCPPLRQARGTVLNTIIEDNRESLAEKGAGSPPHTAKPVISPKLTLKTSGLQTPKNARLARLMSPLSAGTTSSCSDTEWQQQMQGFDDLYDATEDEDMDDDYSTDVSLSDSCFSAPNTRPGSLVTPITRNSLTSTGSTRKRGLTLDIPSPSVRLSMNGACKSSPIPPTPPPKIPVSPAALSMLARSVPASHAPPSLDGSISSDQESNLSALATPDTHSLPDTNWDAHDIHVRPDLDGSERGDLGNEESSPNLEEVPIALENTHEDWRHVLGRFPQIPSTLHQQDGDELSREPTPSDGGLFLPDGALAMLQHIPLNGTPEAWSETSSSNGEMWQLQAPPSRPRSAEGATPASELSSYSFSDLSIPSPGGFFASLGPRARHTWSIPNHNHVPNSATAEGFYNLPWRQDQGEVVEQVIEWRGRPDEEDPDTAIRDGPPTAVRIPCDTPTQSQHATRQESPISVAFDAVQEIPRSGNIYEYDECYDQELQERAAGSLDRTSIWLAAQASYMAALNETNPINEIDSAAEVTDTGEEELLEHDDAGAKKAVRFAEGVPEAISPCPPILASKDSIYWRGFQSIRQRADKTDGFLHRNMRFDAIQSFRIGMVDMHINCLTGKYELVRPERPAYKGPFSKAPRNSIITSDLAEKAQFSKLEKEQLVLSQLCQPMWAMDALRSLNGGKLLTSPAGKRISRTLQSSNPQDDQKRKPIRILDLGGHAACEWAWHAAHEFPDAKVYSVIKGSQVKNNGIKGPRNHRTVSVSNLWELPFKNNQFDVITTRSLHALLKSECPTSLDRDEYDLVLKECRRCLKPGGYLEFMLLDAEISHAGPLATASSVEFAFNLRTRGYDPVASKSFLSRLRAGGFVDIKRAWMFLPMGMEPVETQPPRETPAPRVHSQIEDYEAVQGPVGSTGDIASITGVLGGWMWEQWFVQLRMEMGRDRAKLLEGLGAMFDEGRKTGAGWTCLSGWAMKPRRRRVVHH
ncbi:Methyltransferase type 11 [Penicillium argentinense]|uniref:Methyltransferase type 11 n=1 Tax=Penicillium argentinense TaxID=1131581 RepID=A0A9W9JXH3_9EURO|nr:Methyltransferase type 11 [Penicillium argentinense]KAJ5085095.1 Methyltransferase type 11 [Penicillium argentinense]